MRIASVIPMVSMIPSVLRGVTPTDIEKIKAITRKAFPTIEHISTDQLQSFFDEAEPVLLIDVRSKKEFDISHLAGALNLQSIDELLEAVAGPEIKKVLYCSVGFRSANLAAAVVRKGGKNVANLEGSLFQWANEGRPLYSGSEKVHKVHPFGSFWSGMLNEGMAAPL